MPVTRSGRRVGPDNPEDPYSKRVHFEEYCNPAQPRKKKITQKPRPAREPEVVEFDEESCCRGADENRNGSYNETEGDNNSEIGNNGSDIHSEGDSESSWENLSARHTEQVDTPEVILQFQVQRTNELRKEDIKNDIEKFLKILKPGAPDGILQKAAAIRNEGLKIIQEISDEVEKQFNKVVVTQDLNVTETDGSNSAWSMSALVEKFSRLFQHKNALSANENRLSPTVEVSTLTTESKIASSQKVTTCKRKYFPDETVSEFSEDEADNEANENGETSRVASFAYLGFNNIEYPPVPKSFDFQNMQRTKRIRGALDLSSENDYELEELEENAKMVNTDVSQVAPSTPKHCGFIPARYEIIGRTHSKSKLCSAPIVLLQSKLLAVEEEEEGSSIEDNLELGTSAWTTSRNATNMASLSVVRADPGNSPNSFNIASPRSRLTSESSYTMHFNTPTRSSLGSFYYSAEEDDGNGVGN